MSAPNGSGNFQQEHYSFCLLGFFFLLCVCLFCFLSQVTLVGEQPYLLQSVFPMSMTLPPLSHNSQTCLLDLVTSAGEPQNTLEASPSKPVTQQKREQTGLPKYPGPCPLALHQDTEPSTSNISRPPTPLTEGTHLRHLATACLPRRA